MNAFGFIFLIQAAPNPLAAYLPIILIVLIFYFIVFRPMQTQKKRQQQMLRELKAGDEILTTSGIVGTIVTATDDRLIVRVKPDNIKLQFTRNAVAGLVPEEKKT